ncbi:uncharacterized protein LOC107265461 isoform X2 [Cephus cinctus]|nr:uncharacterized protein LOC107265461 isoform X2 [Cephus cinctus]XP_015590417.1 uncharacterized protein LOC107265461 isoform X2 [Cephus cinctus]XP_015590418.1 uncharacterized protein LOC107265461 isoform X2 [Cephus cinctus]
MTEQGFKLFVNNLPAELQEDGIKAIFNDYGEVSALLCPSEADYAFVSYKTYAEAYKALIHLNEKPPLYMNVSFTKKRESAPIRQFRNDIENANLVVNPETYQDPRYNNKPEYISLGRGKLISGYVPKPVPLPQHYVTDYNSDNEPLYPPYVDPSMYNPYDDVDPFNDTNIMWSRGHVLTTIDGRRHVRMGRGYTAYELPKPRTRKNEDIDKLYEKRIAEAYEYGINNLKDDIGNCEYCAKPSKTNCGRCGAFYCSKECQRSDWLRHRNDCQAMPPLTRCVDSSSISRSSSDDIPVSKQETSSKGLFTLRRPKRESTLNATASCERVTRNENLDNMHTKQLASSAGPAGDQSNRTPTESQVLSKSSNEIHESHDKITVKTTQPAVASSSQETIAAVDLQNSNGAIKKTRTCAKIPFNNNLRTQNKLPGSQPQFNHPTQLFEPTRPRQNGISNQNDSRPEAKSIVNNVSDFDLSFKRRIQFLPKDVFNEIKITRSLPSDGGLYWVQKLSDTEKLENITAHLNSHASTWPYMQPIVGNMYAALYDSKWYRVTVQSLKPFKSLCIDYGYEYEKESTDLRAMKKYINVPGLSEKISIHSDSPAWYKSLGPGSVISVKPVSGAMRSEDQAQDAIIVEVKPDDPIVVNQQESVIEKPPMKQGNIKPKFKSIVNELRANETGVIQFVAETSTAIQSATMLIERFGQVFENVMLKLSERCVTLQEDSNYRPEVDDLVCANRDDDEWFRGRVLVPGSSVRVLSVDEAKVMTVPKVYRLPEEFIDQVTFGVQCKLVERKTPFEVGESYRIEVINVNKNGEKTEVEISIQDVEPVKALITEWVAVPEQMGILNAPLKSGSEVYLSAVVSHYNFHACSLVPEEMERMKRLKLDVNKDAQTAQPLTEIPVLGQMVSSKFADENYYRAMVQKIQGDKIGVVYVDFGNREYTTLGNLKVLRDDLKREPAGCTKMTLKDVPRDVAMTKEVHELLNNLMITEIGLMCTFDGIPSTDGVVLHLPDGTSVNDEVKEMLTPSHKKPAKEEDKVIFMENDLDVTNLGAIGDTIIAEVVSVKQVGICYLVCAPDEQAIVHIVKVLTPLMNAHCQAVQEPYIPRKNELCLAMYDNNWYRALCVDPLVTPNTILVFYVDFGNSEYVEHKNIRPMVKDFMTPPALINICTVTNLCPPGKDELPPNVAARVQSLVQENTQATIKIIKKSAPGEYEVELPTVRAILITEGLLKS